MKIHCFDKRLTTMKMDVNPKDGGSCFNKPKGLCLGTFAWAQVVQDET